MKFFVPIFTNEKCIYLPLCYSAKEHFKADYSYDRIEGHKWTQIDLKLYIKKEVDVTITYHLFNCNRSLCIENILV